MAQRCRYGYVEDSERHFVDAKLKYLETEQDFSVTFYGKTDEAGLEGGRFAHEAEGGPVEVPGNRYNPGFYPDFPTSPAERFLLT